MFKKQNLPPFILLLVIVLILFQLFFLTPLHQHEVPLKMIQFKQVDHQFIATFDKSHLKIAIYTLGTKPKSIDDLLLYIKHQSPFFKLETTGSSVIFPLISNFYNFNNLMTIQYCNSNSCDNLEFLELIRQSQNQLMKKFGFYKKLGYTIIGRNNLILPQVKKQLTSLVKPENFSLKDSNSWYPKIVLSSPEMPSALQYSIALDKYLWSKPIKKGPSNNSAPQFLSPVIQLKLLREFKWSTQCNSFRNIFVDFATYVKEIPKVRAVNLLQYNGKFNDLIANSHAVVEIYSNSLKKWILFDPWFAVYFKYHDKFLSANDIIAMSSLERKNIAVYNVTKGEPLTPEFNKHKNTYQFNQYDIYFGSIIHGYPHHINLES